MKKTALFFIFQLLAVITYSQIVQGLENVRLFSIIANNGDTIHFIKTNADIEKKKPTLIFCQGSLPRPLIIINETQGPYIAGFNFDYWKICDKYNLIEISMPHTPPILPWRMLNKDGCYITSKNGDVNFYDSAYLESNYLENYIYRANCVLGFLKRQKWVDKNQIAVFGHSQGSYIALKLAELNADIKAVGYASGHPEGRYIYNIRDIRRSIISRKLTQEEGQRRIDLEYDAWNTICKGINPDGGDRSKTWTSFTISSWESLIRLKTPIYITYGTEDVNSVETCELLPIYFMKYKKMNFKMNPFVGCGHNFEEITTDGKHNWEKMHWDEAIAGFIEMWENINNKTSPLPISVFDNDTYVIKSIQSDSCINVGEESHENEIELKFRKINFGINQKWYLKKTGEYYKFISRLNNKMLSVSKDFNGKFKIIQESPNEMDNQLWKIIKHGSNYLIMSKVNDFLLFFNTKSEKLELCNPIDSGPVIWDILNIK